MICTSVASINFEECIKVLERVEMAEIRIDLLHFSFEEVSMLFKSAKIPLLATCREGRYSQRERKELLLRSIEAGAAYVDIEVEAEENYREEILEKAKKNRCQVIISYHNFKITPQYYLLKKMVEKCLQYKADLVKIVCTAQTYQDNATILALYNAFNIPLIAFNMGTTGKFSRLAPLYLGGPFTFGALDGEKVTAPGQFTVKELNMLIQQI